MFIDTAKLLVKGGTGGAGANSFYRDKYTRQGHPDGGDGGNGGNVLIRVSTNVHTLIDFHYRQHIVAKDGMRGNSKRQRGATGQDAVMLVPAGTLIYNDTNGELLADLIKENDTYVAAKGGQAGRGNRSHKDATVGTSGEEKTIRLELKLIADVGIIGLPNAGKSTIISKITKAHPKIAPYPFTTTAPVLGVVKLENEEFGFKIAEVPGIIKGAHEGKGLGLLFLRHIERTRFLLHLIDVGENINNPYADYKSILQELKSYGKGLNKKDVIIVANKVDLPDAQKNLSMLKKKIKAKIIPVSGKTGQGIDKLVAEIVKKLKKIRAEDAKKQSISNN